MFYISGIDITNDRQMFNFLKNHFEYYTINSWNRLSTIANNVKLYNLDLSGDWGVAHNLLANGEYDALNWTIERWKEKHHGYEVYFNGRSGGYLILANTGNNYHILPDEILESADYEEYKRYCKEHYGSVKANRPDLIYYTKLVQDFDKLCDELRSYCDELSNLNFEIFEMERAVDLFNSEYADDIEFLGFDYLSCNSVTGEVDISEISALKSLEEAFTRIADRSNFGYSLVRNEEDIIKLMHI